MACYHWYCLAGHMRRAELSEGVMVVADSIWFWQKTISPHMAGLAKALAHEGVSVTYVAEESLSEDRRAQGWIVPELGNARLLLVRNSNDVECAVASAPAGSCHLCQGLRANGLVSVAETMLSRRGSFLMVVMETVDGRGWRGWVRRAVYRTLFWHKRREISAVLAIGKGTPDWIRARGMSKNRIYPFSYFLPYRVPEPVKRQSGADAVFRFIYVGQLIERKRVDMLVSAVAMLCDVELIVVGSGPLESSLKRQAKEQIPGCVKFMGTRTMNEVPSFIAESDCLVLPSDHDGWGAVVSEALMMGTPAVCSDACGASEVVEASGVGGVFRKGDKTGLAEVLASVQGQGRLSRQRRETIAEWGRSLGDRAGARYLMEILVYQREGGCRPEPPWQWNRGKLAAMEEPE